ncbi:MAG: hypothetical protein KGS72_20355 [Cyanobacteria bacterium REEB67]|nr:hypothetical protein [Cyanobacteria bacterium REEB67]
MKALFNMISIPKTLKGPLPTLKHSLHLSTQQPIVASAGGWDGIDCLCNKLTFAEQQRKRQSIIRFGHAEANWTQICECDAKRRSWLENLADKRVCLLNIYS